MRPTEILMGEHRVIERVLACLDVMAEKASETGQVDVASARDAVEFLRTFADKCHHGKEEARLFPAMERAGLPADAGPTAVMRQEHEMGRVLVRRMDDEVARWEKGDREAAGRYAFAARGFVTLLRDHIAKEDQVLFPMADRMLPPAAQSDLLADFGRFETEDLAAGTHERFLAVADALCARHGVTPDDAAAKARPCNCAHGH